jgi:hypothetical protein
MQPLLDATLPPRDRLFQSDQNRHGCTVDNCPRCQGADIWPEVGPGPYGLYCRACQWGGPPASVADGDPDASIAAWNDEARKIALARQMGLTINMVQPQDHPDACLPDE